MISLWFVEWRVTIDDQDKPQASEQKETACSDWAPPWIHTEKGWVDTHSLLIACFIPANCHTFTVIFTHFHIKIGSATHQAYSLIYKFATHFYHFDHICHSFLWFLPHIWAFFTTLKWELAKSWPHQQILWLSPDYFENLVGRSDVCYFCIGHFHTAFSPARRIKV